MSLETIIFNETVVKFFKSELKKVHLLETGGVLLGYVSERTIYVEKASGPGSRAIHEPYYFKADPDYVDMFIDIEIANSWNKLRYLGEWHSHLQSEPEPSETDLVSLYEIAESSNDFCLLAILGAHNFKSSNFLNQAISIIKHKMIDNFYLLDPKIQ